MRTGSLSYLLLLTFAAISAALLLRPISNLFPFQVSLQSRPAHVRPPIMDPPENSSRPEGPVIISDVIGIARDINIYAGLTRDVPPVSERLEDHARNSTVLAPLNSAMARMEHRPWEASADYSALGAKAYEGAGGQDRANSNLRRYVEAHIVPRSPWPEGEEVQTLDGVKLRWESKDGKKIIQPGDIEVVRVANTVANGEVWVVNGVINPA